MSDALAAKHGAEYPWVRPGQQTISFPNAHASPPYVPTTAPTRELTTDERLFYEAWTRRYNEAPKPTPDQSDRIDAVQKIADLLGVKVAFPD